MSKQRLPRTIAALATTAALAAAQGNLELGKMWRLENPPLAYLQAKYGFTPSREWLDALRLASLRLNGGCSAAFVSGQGLIMTNHHCARHFIAAASPKDEDWLQNGFCAAARTDEVRLEGLSARQLVAMRDVTAAVNHGVGASDNASDNATARALRTANQRQIIADARSRNPGFEPRIVKLYQGAVFQLYSYRVYDDIRLVCAPHLQISHFGGDPDNFTFPRYAIDFTFCRAYENDRPADTKAHYFRWSKTGASKGELVFVTGNPHSTARLQTVAQLAYLRDANYPILRQLIANRLALMRQIVTDDPECLANLRNHILSYENAQKAYFGYHTGLLDDTLMARKRRAEAEFRSKVRSNPALDAEFGGAWDQLAEIAALETANEPQRRFHSDGQSKHLRRAIAVVEAVSAGTAPDTTSAAKQALAMSTEMSVLEDRTFVDHLERARQWLPRSDPYYRALLADHSAIETARQIATSAISDTAFVRELLAGGETTVLTSKDPAIRAALVLVPLRRARSRMMKWLHSQESALEAKIGQALFACYGDNVSPDATGTLRFSDGVVAGFAFNGTIAPHRTSFYGLYARSTAFFGKSPFALPRVWLERKNDIDMTKSVNFVSTNDIITGNSGSPIVNRDLEVVGLVFDSNMQMLPNRFVYTDDTPRAVSVHVQAIMESLRKIYGAGHVADELLGQ